MTPSKAQEILAILIGAYPNQQLTEEMANTWANVLATIEFSTAEQAAREWVRTERWWPTPAQLNGVITRLRGEERDSGAWTPPETNIRCDGTGWIDRGDGPTPCPACNPWLHELWQHGDLHKRHPKAPAGYMMPLPCNRRPTPDDRIVTDRSAAMRLVVAGYREAKREAGWSDPEIDERLSKRYQSVLGWVSGIPQPTLDETAGFDGEVVDVE